MWHKRFLWLMLLGLAAPLLFGQDTYRKYRLDRAEEPLLTITLEDKKVTATVYGPDSLVDLDLESDRINRRDGMILVDETPFLIGDSLYAAGGGYALKEIIKTSISFSDDHLTEIWFYRQGETDRQFRSRKRNLIGVEEKMEVEASRFVRGSVIGFWSDIEIKGEVNEDIISLYGDISVGNQAVVRGDIVAVGGRVTIAEKASIYGEILAGQFDGDYQFDRWRRWYRRDRNLYPVFRFYYNRVDGATPFFGIGFNDEDSLLPSFELGLGAGLASERFRFWVSLEQSVVRDYPLTIGASFYKRLASPDDHIVSLAENSVFALLATEDYKDFYEALGGYAFTRFCPRPGIRLEAGLLSEKHRWLAGHPHLWSLFGGSKFFRRNFSTAPSETRAAFIESLDNRRMTSLILKASLDAVDEDFRFQESEWKMKAELEMVPSSWNSGYDFSRFFGRIGHFRAFSNSVGLLLSAAAGSSDGLVPLHRRFFIGGLGTLPGYEYKEFIGSAYWIGSLEGRFVLPRTDIAARLHYHGAQISSEPENLFESEVRQSFGAGLSFEESLHFDLARRLDRSGGSFELTVMFSSKF